MKPNRTLVCGVGINDANYIVKTFRTIGYKEDGRRIRVREWFCPFYLVWSGMITRCYSKTYLARNPSYNGCIVSEEWKTFSNFKDWMETQDWVDKQLDKDLLVPGNKVYSADTCVFVDGRVNTFVIECDSRRGDHPIGVYWHKSMGKYMARLCDGRGGSTYLGYHSTAEAAHEAWLDAKLKLAKELAAEIIAGGGDARVAKAIVERYENYKYTTYV